MGRMVILAILAVFGRFWSFWSFCHFRQNCQNRHPIFFVLRFDLVLHCQLKFKNMLHYYSTETPFSKGFHHGEGLYGVCPITCCNLFNYLNQLIMASKNLSKKIANDPNFERVRENNAEFGRAGKAGKLLTDALRAVVNKSRDSKQTSRLSKVMDDVLKTDAVSDRGQRKVSEGDIMLLKGFDYNVDAKLTTVFFAPYTAAIDRATGTLKVDIPAFIPQTMLNAPPNTTHFMLVSGAAEVDFDTGTQNGANASTAQLAYSDVPTEPISLSHTLTANSTGALFLALGVKFYQNVNNKFYPLHSGKFNAVAIVQVDVPNP